MSALRIALVLHGWPGRQAGGTGMVAQALAMALLELGHRVCVLAPEASVDRTEAEELGVDFLPLRAPSPGDWPETWLHPQLDQHFHEQLQKWRPDIVHFHHFSGLSFGMAEVARSLGARVVLCLHDYALPCARGQLVTHEGQRCEALDSRACGRCLSHISPVGPSKSRTLRAAARIPGLARGGRALLSRMPRADLQAIAQQRLDAAAALLCRVDRLEAPSKDLCDRMERLGLPRPALAPLPLVHRIHPDPDPGSGPLRFLFIGSLIPTKGAVRLVEAHSRLPPGQSQLSIVGDPVPFFGREDYLLRLRELAAASPSVQLRGPISPSEMTDLLASHDVLVLPSTWAENSPLVVREATAAGLRTIVSSIGGAAELDPLCQQVDPDQADALVQAMALELERGRGRNPVRSWPDPMEVAQWHIENSYGAISST